MVNDADGSEYPTRAVFDEVRAPELLVWTESHSGMRVRAEFVALGPRAHRSEDPSDLCARGVPGTRGPGRLPLVARPLRCVSRRAGRRDERRRCRRRRTATPDHRRRVRRAGRPVGGRRAGRLGRAVAVRGVAHPRSRGPRDHAGALRRSGLHGGARGAPAATSRACPTPLRHATARCRRHPARRPPLPGLARMGATGWWRRGRTDPLRDPRARHHRGGAAWRGGCPSRASARSSRSWKPTMGRTCSGSISATWRYGRTT